MKYLALLVLAFTFTVAPTNARAAERARQKAATRNVEKHPAR